MYPQGVFPMLLGTSQGHGPGKVMGPAWDVPRHHSGCQRPPSGVLASAALLISVPLHFGLQQLLSCSKLRLQPFALLSQNCLHLHKNSTSRKATAVIRHTMD